MSPWPPSQGRCVDGASGGSATSVYATQFIQHTGGSTLTASYRTPPLVLNPGMQLNLSIETDTNSAGQIVVTGQLTSDPDGGAN